MINKPPLMDANFHEDFNRSVEVQASSDRIFGFIVAAFVGIFGIWPVRPPLVIAAGVFGAIALLRPSMLHPLNLFWGKLGMLGGRILNPVITGLVFFAVVTPTGIWARRRGKDSLRLRRAAPGESYWIDRNPPGPAPETMTKQF